MGSEQDMVERVARAIDPEAFESDAVFATSAPSPQDLAYSRARAAIEAMRKPTKANVRAGMLAVPGTSSVEVFAVAASVWRAMIEDMLATHTKTGPEDAGEGGTP